MNFKIYPLQFNPIFKERIWGGSKLKALLDKPIASDTIGESWEVSTVEGDVSVIANGAFTGQSLLDIIETYPEEILGAGVFSKFGKQFPLLCKYIDAKDDLSIQVHPNDELAKKRHNSYGKTEMWYIMQADENAKLITGFKKNSDTSEFLQNLKDKTLPSILDIKVVTRGDVFFIQTGTIHAIGAGIVLAEIQQTSDVTYRVYDWDRVDQNGNPRELHLDLALDAINYDVVDTQKEYDKENNESNPMVVCPYFTTNYVPLDGKIAVDKTGNSFTVYMCVEGSFGLDFENVNYPYKKGDTVLIPAAMKKFVLNGNASLLEIYIS
ncbi:type I phosphomannose isomerase catalytic subunit [Flavobacterium sp. GT3R68]|uniref:type I phosphomannose isomerase catalytic subunit n=1 Tax=Flavobacterium sp. GT3R68 TaxID=2594437 RepID=UPI000F869B9B|nr:type I phosphomannose isomerase catalytic subunit [Flavobacterium sp. GT3R68]RTY92229.1 mannose-6-phosphate isomerase [Flavobacterium sp. GSN2]TRW92465.1 mannose-6-phosphate isomerase [Flavobacterium sp. GT3R68]